MKSNKIMLIISTIMLSCLVVGISFAWWTISKKQQGNNIFNTACLSVSYVNETGTISLDKTQPITDAEGQNQEGYSFTIKNNCNQKVAYLVNLDVFNVTGAVNLDQAVVNLAIDNRVARALDNYAEADKYSSDASYAKNIYSGVLQAKEEYTHKIKMWVDVNAGNEAQNAKFKSQIFVIAGQNIMANEVASEDCFITNNNTIIKYKNYMCSGDIIVPQYINGTEITDIEMDAFIDANVLWYTDWDAFETVFVIFDEKNFNSIKYVLENIDQAELWTDGIRYVKVSEMQDWDVALSGMRNSDYFWLKVPIGVDLSYYNGTINQHTLLYSSMMNYSDLIEQNKYIFSVKSLDLSRLKNLKYISNNITYNNLKLTKLELPEGLERINAYVFQSNSIENLFLPTTLKEIQNSAFSNNKIEQIEFNSEITLGDSVFKNNNINKLTLNNTIILGDAVFSGNTNLTTDNIHIGYFSNNTMEELLLSAVDVDE